MQAIVTKYIGPSNTKGARIKAVCDSGSITIPYPYGLSVRGAHERVARALVSKLEWEQGEWTCGSLPNSAGYVFVRRD